METAIITALSAGTAAFSKGAIGAAGKDAYEALKGAVLRFVGANEVAQLEQKPNSQAPQDVLAEKLTEAGKAEDAELAELAWQLIAVLKADGAIGGAIGVTLEEVEAANIRLKEITAGGTGVSVKKTKASGNIEISNVTAGQDPKA